MAVQPQGAIERHEPTTLALKDERPHSQKTTEIRESNRSYRKLRDIPVVTLPQQR